MSLIGRAAARTMRVEVRKMKRAATKRAPQRDELDIDLQRRQILGMDSITIELELAEIFCKLALESHSPERKRQHELCAHRALNAALDTLTRLHLKGKEAGQIVTQIEEVKALLKAVEANGRSGPKC